jgi:hypothetical protein
MRKFILAFAAALFAAQAPAQLLSSEFKVAGVHIGDSPSDVLKALRAEGYGVTRVSRSDSFAQRLSDAKNAELRRPLDRVRSTDIEVIIAEEADQRVRVRFDDGATGSRVVSSVHYEASSVARPFSRILKTLVDRYGRPQASDGTGAFWCTNDPPDVCLAGGVHGGRLKVGHDYRCFNPSCELTTIELQPGTDLLNLWKARFDKALAPLLRSKDAF